MSKDIFGYDTSTTQVGSNILSSDMLLVSVTGKNQVSVNALTQSVQVEYSRQVSPVYVMGETTVKLVPSVPTGTLTIGRCIGTGDRFASILNNNDPCAVYTITVMSAGNLCGNELDAGTIIATGLATRYGLQANAGPGQMVVESMTFTINSLTVSSSNTTGEIVA